MPPTRRLRNSKPEDTAGDAFRKDEMFGEKRQNDSLLNGTGGKKQRLEDSSSSSSPNNKNTSETEVEDFAIGIDLGTTYSCVGVFQYGKVEIIANDQGFKTTPSYVAFTDEEILIGDAAKAQETRNLRSTIYGAKRLIGRQFFDVGVQTDIQNFPFEVINEDQKPKIKINVNGETKTFFPQEISAMVLVKMKETAEAYLGRPVKKAVITVPAYFNDAQRQATKDAAAIAKLEVLRIINEPTAAALAYGLEKKVEGERYVMIFDLGGGTFDVSILNIDKDFFEVVSTTGDTHLGGEDFDNRMVNHFAEEFNRKYRKDLRQNKKAIRRLKTACEKVKRELSSSTIASLDLDSLHEGIDFYSSITRARFEELNADLFRKTLEPVEKSIRDAGIDKSKIQDVVLVGGSTRIPKIQKLLSEFFNGKELSRSVNPDEAVAYGAAIQAALLNNDGSKEVVDLVLVDVTPLSLGVEVRDTKDMDVIVKRNTTIPTKETKILTTMYDYQTTVCFKVFEGEHPKTIFNNLLGKFTLTDIPPAPRQVPKFEVTFDIDASGILNVTAVERETGNKNGITLTYNNTRFSQEEIDRMINDAQTYKERLESQKGLSAAKNSLESFCLDLKRTVLELQDDFLIDSDKRMIANKCDEAVKWVISTDVTDVEVFEQKQQELEDVFNIVISIAKDPSLKEEKYRELLNLTSKADEDEIREGFRQVSRKYHPDKYNGEKEIGEMMFRIAVNAHRFLTSLV